MSKLIAFKKIKSKKLFILNLHYFNYVVLLESYVLTRYTNPALINTEIATLKS